MRDIECQERSVLTSSIVRHIQIAFLTERAKSKVDGRSPLERPRKKVPRYGFVYLLLPHISSCADHTSLDAPQSRLVLIVGLCKKNVAEILAFPFVGIFASVHWKMSTIPVQFVQKAFC